MIIPSRKLREELERDRIFQTERACSTFAQLYVLRQRPNGWVCQRGGMVAWAWSILAVTARALGLWWLGRGLAGVDRSVGDREQ